MDFSAVLSNIKSVLPIINLFSSKEIKKLFGIKFDKTINIYGNFKYFYQDQLDEKSRFYLLICFYNFNGPKNIDKDGYSYYIVGKIGYISFFKEYFSYIKNYIKYRKDLNIITRIYISFIQAKYRVKRLKYITPLEKYLKKKEKYDKYIEEYFKEKKIERLYIYKINNDNIFQPII